LLATYDPSSVKSCEKIIAELDEQHALLVPEYKAMQAICKTIHEARKDAVGILLDELKDRK